MRASRQNAACRQKPRGSLRCEISARRRGRGPDSARQRELLVLGRVFVFQIASKYRASSNQDRNGPLWDEFDQLWPISTNSVRFRWVQHAMQYSAPLCLRTMIYRNARDALLIDVGRRRRDTVQGVLDCMLSKWLCRPLSEPMRPRLHLLEPAQNPRQLGADLVQTRSRAAWDAIDARPLQATDARERDRERNV